MNPNTINRRQFFDSVQNGLYGAALASLLSRDLYGVEPHHKALVADGHASAPAALSPRAKAVIQFCMQGGPSQVDLFDPKPALEKFHGADAPEEFTKRPPAQHEGQGDAQPLEVCPPRPKRRVGERIAADTAKMIDEIAIIRSMYNVHENHEPACYKWRAARYFPATRP